MSAPEAPARIEPCLLEEARGELLDLLTEIPAAATALGSRLHPRTAASLADLVRVMNCYYSNLIEGHNTRPCEIERALANDLDADEPRRNLQLEARQHIRLQRDIDRRYAEGNLPAATSTVFICDLHRDFYHDAPEAMMDHADMPRQGDLDGRGNLSLRALEEFSLWFLKVCLDQIWFMGGLFRLDELAERLRAYASSQGWRSEASVLLVEILHRGEIGRGEAEVITGLKERTSRDLLGLLLDDGIIGSNSQKGPVSLRFPAKSLDVLFPRLYPQS